MSLIIRPCSADDLVALRATSTETDFLTHRDRFEEQDRGESTYLMAWSEEDLAGHLKIRWTGSVHDRVRQQFPSVPEFRRLRVSPDRQGQGIGSQLLAAAESLVAQQGFYFSGLCVAVGNVGARRLYQRHGYFDWGQGTFVSSWQERDEQGILQPKSHEVTYMTKALTKTDRASA